MRLYERFAEKDFHTSVATTFGIDFDAYESIVLSRLRGAGCRNNIVITDSRMLTHALGGASLLPRQAGRLYTVTGAGAAGVFHPKAFLQFGRRRARLIVGSANLTATGLAGNLELVGMIECDDTASGEQQLIAQAWAYVSRLIDTDQQALSEQAEWMRARTRWLTSAIPATGLVRLADETAAALLTSDDPVGVGRRFAGLIDAPVERLIVISPYWDMDLAALSFLTAQLSLKSVSILIDPEDAAFPKHALGKVPGAVRLYDRGDFRKGRFIHAKAIIAQTAGADHLLFGSANCTEAALGLLDTPGLNAEVCLYRRLPPGSTIKALGLADVLTDERTIDPAALPDTLLDEELPFDDLAAQNPGKFECRVDTLMWHPPARITDPAACTITLLDQQGQVIAALLTPLADGGSIHRYQISGTEERPAFARITDAAGRISAPAIVTLIDRLRAAVRETATRQADKALRELENETEASLMLLDVLGVLEKLDRDDNGSKEPISIPLPAQEKDEPVAPEHRILSYEEFVAARRPRTAGPHIAHDSFAGSDVSVVRGLLNRIIGLAAGDHVEEVQEDDALADAFNLGDETASPEADIAAGEEFDKPRAKTDDEEGQAAQRQRAAAQKATKSQLVAATKEFHNRIMDRKESGALDKYDMLRLRALLMVVCTASRGGPALKGNNRPRSRLQVLPPENDPDSWPIMIGRLLFDIFGGRSPAVRHLYLSGDHDQIPDDLVECWATCYWCLQACLNAPLSKAERERITRYLTPMTDLAYRLTLPTKEELLGVDVMTVMEGMSASYAERLGITPEHIIAGHRSVVEGLLKDAPASRRP
ncbi:MAG: hypothetical protein ACRED5_03635 [Propylenella sp.]